MKLIQLIVIPLTVDEENENMTNAPHEGLV